MPRTTYNLIPFKIRVLRQPILQNASGTEVEVIITHRYDSPSGVSLGGTITMLNIPVASPVGARYQSPPKRFVPPAKLSRIPAQKAYHVVLSEAAKAQSLKLDGYSASVISLKLGLDIKTVSHYLNITASTANSPYKSTYALPKTTSARNRFAPPKTLTSTVPRQGTYAVPNAIVLGREQPPTVSSQQGAEPFQLQPSDENTHLVVP